MPYTNPHPVECPWHAFTNAVGAPNLKWCEETQCSWLSEPANALSNLVYLLVSFAVYRQTRASPHAELTRLGPMLLWVGVSSALYHASNNYATQVHMATATPRPGQGDELCPVSRVSHVCVACSSSIFMACLA